MISAKANGQELDGVGELLKDSGPGTLGAEPAWTCGTSMEKIAKAVTISNWRGAKQQGLWIDKDLNNKESRKLLKKINLFYNRGLRIGQFLGKSNMALVYS